MAEIEPSDWAYAVFGEAAAPLMEGVSRAIIGAHDRAMGAHLGGGMRTADAYGSTLAVAQFEELVRETKEIAGVRVEKPLGLSTRFGLVMLGDPVTALYPWRYARDASTRREDARLLNPSKIRTRLLTLPSAGPVAKQLSFDEHADLSEDELDELLADEEAMREQINSLGRVVTIGYASNPIGPGAVFNLGWGFAELNEDTGAMVWNHWEPLSVLGPNETDQQSPRRPVLRTVDADVASKRFDDAPLNDDLELVAQARDNVPASPEREREPDQTGSFDE